MWSFLAHKHLSWVGGWDHQSTVLFNIFILSCWWDQQRTVLFRTFIMSGWDHQSTVFSTLIMSGWVGPQSRLLFSSFIMSGWVWPSKYSSIQYIHPEWVGRTTKYTTIQYIHQSEWVGPSKVQYYSIYSSWVGGWDHKTTVLFNKFILSGWEGPSKYCTIQFIHHKWVGGAIKIQYCSIYSIYYWNSNIPSVHVYHAYK